MKVRIFLGLVASSALAVSTAIAAPASVSTTLKAGMLHPPLDITVINSSSYSIYINLQNGSEVAVYPGNSQHLYGYDNRVFSYPLLLENANHQNIYAYNVCREAIVVVNNSEIRTDNDLCNP